MIAFFPSEIEAIRKILNKSEPIVIVTHQNPDGDAIGSALALWWVLLAEGFQAKVVIPNEMPEFLKWMAGTDEIIIAKSNFSTAKQQIAEAKVIFCLDFNSLSRTEDLEKPLRESNATKVLIDHHLAPEHFTTLMLSRTETSSTAELVFQFIKKTFPYFELSSQIAEGIYVGIITDTGSLSYSCNLTSTYLILAELIATGIDGEAIHRKIYDTYSEERIKLLGYCLSEKMVVLKDKGIAYICLSQNELNQFNYVEGDTEGIVNYPLSIKGIVMSVLITEREKVVKFSFRSKGDFAVNTIAKAHFNGGGHRNASGGNLKMPFAEAVAYFESLINKFAPNA